MSDDKVALSKAVLSPATNVSVARPHGSAPVPQPVAQKDEPAPLAKAVAPSVEEIAERIQTYLKDVNRALEFRVDADSGRTVVTVRDAESGDLIRQIPSEEVLRFAQLAEEQTIVLLNEKV